MRLSSRLIAGTAALLLCQGWVRPAPAQPPTESVQPSPSSGRGEAEAGIGSAPREVIILNKGANLGELLSRLKQPDLIIMKPGPSGGRAGTPAATQPDRSHAFHSVRILGRVEDDLANLALELELSLLAAGDVWVPLGVNSQIISSAREGERELALRRRQESGLWEVLLAKQGLHRLQLQLRHPVKINPERKRLEMAVPEAPSTYLELDVPGQVLDVDLGAGESIGKAPAPGGRGTRLSAHLSPRSRLALSWADEANSAATQSPLLTAQVEMEIDVDASAVITRSSWAIRCVRGIARKLEIRLDDQDVVTQLKLDDQFLLAGIERNVLKIPLSAPFRPRETRQLVMETRRPLPQGAARPFEFSGLPLSSAVEQSGAMAVTQSANLWVNVKTSQGLRRIDPRELPKGLRALPGISGAFLFLDQPFKLGLEVVESSPLYRTESTTRLMLEGDVVKSEASIEVQRVRGRLFELEVALPPGLQFLSAGPPEVVESIAPLEGRERSAGGAAPGPVGQSLKVRLTSLARDQRSFVLRLSGQQRIDAAGEMNLGLFSLPESLSPNCTVALFADRNATFEVDREHDSESGSARAAHWQIRPEIVGSALYAIAGRGPILTLRSTQGPRWLKGRLRRQPISITHDTRVGAVVFARGVDVRQESSIAVRHGPVRSLTIRAPKSIQEAWSVQGKETIDRAELPREAGQPRRYRLTFDPPISDRSNLVFRFHVPLDPALSAATDSRGLVECFRVEEGTAQDWTAQLSSRSGIEVAAGEVPGAAPAAEAAAAGAPEQADVRRLLSVKGKGEAPALAFAARLQVAAELPPVVVPRALFRTTLAASGELRTQAVYWVESHPPRLSFRLPEGARWIRARIDGRTAESIEQVPESSGYRLVLPPDAQARPILLELEYQASGTVPRGGLTAPDLGDGTVVLQSLWQVQLPWSQAIVGVPEGWSDENEWYWDVYVWKRRPWKSFGRLLSWVAGSPAQAALMEEGTVEEQDRAHAYLFSRSGGPVALRPAVASRALLVGMTSGCALIIGFLLIFARMDFRWVWAAAAVLGLLAAAMLHPSTLVLLIQSSLFGVVLALLGLLIQRLIDRGRTRGASPSGLARASVPSGPAPAAASAAAVGGVGSDDSTAIRVRVASSTMDYIPPPISLAPAAEPAESSRIGPA